MFQGKYEILEQINSGGFAAVYRARKINPDGSDTIVALKLRKTKVLFTDSAGTVSRKDEWNKNLFRREVEFMSACRYLKGILNCHEYSIHEHSSLAVDYLEMEYFAGESLAEVIWALSLKDIFQIVYSVAEILVELHGQGIAHRDVKPENILIRRKGERFIVKLADLGCAADYKSSARENTSLGVLGTPPYISPTRARGSRYFSVQEENDIYSLGVILFMVLAGGQYPYSDFREEDKNLIMQQTVTSGVRMDRLNHCVEEITKIIRFCVTYGMQPVSSARGLMAKIAPYVQGKNNAVEGMYQIFYLRLAGGLYKLMNSEEFKACALRLTDLFRDLPAEHRLKQLARRQEELAGDFAAKIPLALPAGFTETIMVFFLLWEAGTERVLPTFLLELRITVMAMVYEKYGDFLAAEHLAGQLADLEIMSEDDYLTDHYEWRIRNRLINEFKIPPSGLKKFEEFKKKEWELRKKLKVTEIIPVTRVDLFSFLDWSLCQQVSAEKLAVILAWYETDRYDLLDNIPAQEWKTFEDNLKSYKKQSIRRARKKRNTLKIEYITVAVESAV